MTRHLTFVLLALIGMLCVGGCFNRTHYPGAGSPVRLGQSIKSVRVWLPRIVKDDAGKERTVYDIPSKCDLDEGGFFLPDWEDRTEE